MLEGKKLDHSKSWKSTATVRDGTSPHRSTRRIQKRAGCLTALQMRTLTQELLDSRVDTCITQMGLQRKL